MNGKRILPFFYIFLAAFILEVTVFAASFWKTCRNEGVLAEHVEYVYGHVDMMDMHLAPEGWSEENVYKDEAGFIHIPAGELLMRIKDVDCSVEQLELLLKLPAGSQVKATVFMQDEGNAYTYQLGQERNIWEFEPSSAGFLVYPYGKVKEIYIRIASAAAGQELVCNAEGAVINGRMPFTFSGTRVGILYLILLVIYIFSSKSELEKVTFWPENMSIRQKGIRLAAIACCTFLAVLLSVSAVLSNPVCRKNLGLHHAQYQELAVALSKGETAVGMADERLLSVDNPYDTIYLQANQIHYQADYAYKDGKYFVYFGIVPELLLYLPYYQLTGKDFPNYLAVLLFCAGFAAACAGLVYEFMRRYFGKLPFYLYPVCVFMLGFGYPLFYMQIRPDLYHVPIAASCMFTMLSLWLVLAGERVTKLKPYLWGAGALCMALNAGCRPQFLIFSLLLVPLCVPTLWTDVKNRHWRTLAAMVLPYLTVAAGIMYYNYIRFGSPIDFGATYSMTSNDMTHRGFNLSRIFYSAWYYLFEIPWLEGVFPYLRSASIETDYVGRIVSESCFGGIFACSMLYWPVFAVLRAKKRLRKKKLTAVVWLSIAASLIICAADSTGAGILQRYMADQMPGFALAAVILLLVIAEWAQQRGLFRYFAGWLRIAVILHVVFLVLILINVDSSISIANGNPRLYAEIWSLLQF